MDLTTEAIVMPPMFGSALSIEQLWPRHAHFRTPYIAGVKARTCFLSIGLVMESAIFWFVLIYAGLMIRSRTAWRMTPIRIAR